jgi:tetratricopeptide (TPR) repeat protein
MPKTADKRNLPKTPPIEDERNGQGAGRMPPAGKATTGAASKPGRSQMEVFQEGMRMFHARQFAQALELFQAAQAGPDRTVANRAGLHARMCERRLESHGVELKTPEDHYNYAVTLMNARDLGAAQKHLLAALEADPKADHVLYALAACQSLAGDLHGAYENLKRAIDLQPRNRLAARQDPDFSPALEQAGFARLLYPDKK